MPTYATWQSRPVFITSTFRDMQAERDYLHAHVFPELEERLRRRLHFLEPIDLRWGVETISVSEQQSKELLVLKVCLNEISRSRPFLLALMGDRYGWVPPTERMKAAADEAGYFTDPRGKSVTALEIEYGILDSPDQRKLSRFYFRDPLPYDQMGADAADYSDLHSGEPGAAAAHERLEQLKARIERQMPGRVRRYRAEWSAEHRAVTGLEAWGVQVLEDLWSDLDEATREYEHAEPATWQQEESWVLEQFIQTQCREFIGRSETVNDLLALAESPAAPDAEWGACVSGEPGSGKSSLLGQVVKELQKREDMLLLTHAAGISARAGQVDTLLRRWVQQLAESLGIPDPAEGVHGREELEKFFAELLSRAAVKQRVVCLLDALNQFERTPAARHLTWLPELWPSNARLIATANPGEEAAALGKRRGVRPVAMPVLNEKEAGSIAASVCRRYHRGLAQEIVDILLAKRLPDGRQAAGNPLWLALALEELNLLDADDFARVDREFTGTSDQRLHALMCAVAGELPPAIESLYGWLLERTEKLHGENWARGFAQLIALSRTGWRESDMRELLPRVSGQGWDPLRFAALRRSFRAHLVQRGGARQWDFSHAQMRAAVARRTPSLEKSAKILHATIADYLDELHRGDPLRVSEMMHHLIQADDREWAAAYYAATRTPEELEAATRSLADFISSHVEEDPNPALEWVLATAGETSDDCHLYLLLTRWDGALDPALADRLPVAPRVRLRRAGVGHFEGLLRRTPDSEAYGHDLAASYSKLGDLELAAGDLQAARASYERSRGLFEDLRCRVPDSAVVDQSLAVSYGRLSDLELAAGDLQAAQAYHEKVLEILDYVRRRAPVRSDSARNLAVTYSKRGDLQLSQGDQQAARALYEKSVAMLEDLRRQAPDSADYAFDLAVAYSRLAGLLTSLGDLHAARSLHEKSLEISENLRRRAPDSTDYARSLAVSYSDLGDLELALGDPQAARASYEKTIGVFEDLRRRAPDSTDHAFDLAVAYSRFAGVLLCLDDLQAARSLREKSVEISEDLHRRVPDSANYAHGLAVSYSELADLRLAEGEPRAARSLYKRAIGLFEDLRRRAPGSAESARDLVLSYSRLGDLQLAQGKSQAALALYEKSIGVLEDLRLRAPDSAEGARDLALSYSKLGDLRLSQGEPQVARALYQKATGMFEDLRRRAPDSADDARNLAVSTANLGDLELDLGDQQTARGLHEKAFEIYEGLRGRAPDNADYAHGLALSCRKLGDLQVALGDPQVAQTLHEKALEIWEDLRRRAPDNPDYARELAVSCSKLGELQLAQGDPRAARGVYERYGDLCEDLLRGAPDNPDYANYLCMSYARLADLALQTGDARDALTLYERLFELLDDLERRMPDFAFQPGTPNQAVRGYFLGEVAETAVALRRSGDAVAAEQATRFLKAHGFDPSVAQ